MFAYFTLRDLAPLFVATTTSLGGFWPLFDARAAMLEFGLPLATAQSRPAQAVFITQAMRTSALGALVWVFYLQGKRTEVDAVLAVMGLTDGYVCWRQGMPAKAAFRTVSGLLIAAWGLAGMTAGALSA